MFSPSSARQELAGLAGSVIKRGVNGPYLLPDPQDRWSPALGCQHQALGVSAALWWVFLPEPRVIDEVWGQQLDEEQMREQMGQGD